LSVYLQLALLQAFTLALQFLLLQTFAMMVSFWFLQFLAYIITLMSKRDNILLPLSSYFLSFFRPPPAPCFRLAEPPGLPEPARWRESQSCTAPGAPA
jgi:hypothetical protein